MSSSKQAASSDAVRKVELNAQTLDAVAYATLEGDVARRLHVIPVTFEGDRMLLAMADTKDLDALNEVAALTVVPCGSLGTKTLAALNTEPAPVMTRTRMSGSTASRSSVFRPSTDLAPAALI